MGNCQVERAKLSAGFIPLGVKEYGGVIYIASYNPDTDECELGSFPSPERDITGVNAIENQTGLTDGHFNSSDFSLPISRVNGEFIPDEILFKIQKLNEPEVLKLNPGDKFITTYKLNPIPDADITLDNFDSYFSFNRNAKSLFQITFYKIDGNNNITEMDPEDVKSIPYRNGIEEDEYTYYVESNGGTIAVGLELTPLVYFNSNVREVSKRSEVNKKIRIEALGQSDSNVKFNGVRVDVLKNENENEEAITFHVAKIGNVQDKISASLSDLEEGDKVKIEITPYSQFNYFPKLMQTFNLEMGKNLNGDNINNVFKWYVRENVNRLELDFDFTYELEGDSKMYLEFYDPWSNISSFKVIQSPSIYSNMNLSINLVDEPRTNIFDNYTANNANTKNQKGGVPFTKLSPYVDGVLEPLLVNADHNNGIKLVRNDESLRKNHFYIVRICLYEEIENDENQIERKYYNYYKALYTNTAYNDLYDEQRALNIDDINYKPDFTKIPYPLDKLQFTGTLDKSLPPVVTSKIGPYDETLTTQYKGYDYFFNLEKRPNTPTLKVDTIHDIKKQYNIKLDKKTNLYYGYLKSELLDIVNTSSSNVTNITNNENIDNPIENTGKLMFNKIDDSNAVVELNINTTRPAKSKIQNAESNVVRVNEKLSNYLYQKDKKVFTPGVNSNMYYDTTAFYIGRNRRGDNKDETNLYLNVGNRGIVGVIRLIDQDGWDPNNVLNHLLKQNGEEHNVENDKDVFNRNVVNRPDRLYDSIPNNDQFLSTLLNHKQILDGSSGNKGKVIGWVKNTGIEQTEWPNIGITFIAKSDSTPRTVVFPIKVNELTNINEKIKKFLDNLYHIKIEEVLDSLGYYLSPNYSFYENEETRIEDLMLNLRTTWNLPNVKTYLFKALYGSVTQYDFSTQMINDLISNSILKANSNHTFLNGDIDVAIEDNRFIPYVSNDTEIVNYDNTLSLGEFTINLSTDPKIRYLFANSYNAYQEYISEINESDPKVLEKIYVDKNAPEEYKESLVEFSSLFKYNSNGNSGNKIQLINDAGNFNYKVVARNSDKATYRLYIFDAYNKLLKIE